jgi:hypothetical protein
LWQSFFQQVRPAVPPPAAAPQALNSGTLRLQDLPLQGGAAEGATRLVEAMGLADLRSPIRPTGRWSGEARCAQARSGFPH